MRQQLLNGDFMGIILPFIYMNASNKLFGKVFRHWVILSWDKTDAVLQKAFASYGEITEAKVIPEYDTGHSRGFGFVAFVRDEDAKTAISKMHGTNLDGRTITVNEAQERSPRGGGRGERNR